MPPRATLAGLGTNGDFVQTSTCGATLAIGASCTASIAFRPTLVSDPLPLVGVLTVAGSFGGSPMLLNLQGLGVTSTGAATQTQLTAAPNPATVGQTVTLTAAVASPSSGSPSGTVTFFEGATTLGSGTLASGQATLALSTLAAGTHSITAQYGGDTSFGASTSAAVSVQVNAAAATADFSVQASPTTLTVVAGQSATTTLSVTPINGFGQAVSLACSGLPVGASCSFAPASVTPAGAAVSTVLTIATNGNTVSAMAPVNDPALPGTPGPGQPALVLASLGVVAIRVAGGLRFAPLARSMSQRWRRHLRRLVAALATLGAVALIGACGGSPSGGGVSVSSPGTPAGTSTVTVTATSASGTVSHAVTLSLVVTR